MSDNENDNKQETPQYMTAKDLNGALTNYDKKMTKLMNDKFDQLLSQIQPKQEEPAPALSKTVLTEETLELKKQIKILMDRDKQRDVQDKQMRLENKLRETLNKHGVKSRDSFAVKALKDQVTFDEDGNLVMKVDEITHPLDEAIAKFVQTDDGKFLQDAKDIRGSGSTPAYRSSTGAPAADKVIELGDGSKIYSDLSTLRQVAQDMVSKQSLIR